jgi:hypothetical protein
MHKLLLFWNLPQHLFPTSCKSPVLKKRNKRLECATQMQIHTVLTCYSNVIIFIFRNARQALLISQHDNPVALKMLFHCLLHRCNQKYFHILAPEHTKRIGTFTSQQLEEIRWIIELWRRWWNENRQKKPEYSEKTLLCAALLITNITKTYYLRSNPVRHDV